MKVAVLDHCKFRNHVPNSKYKKKNVLTCGEETIYSITFCFSTDAKAIIPRFIMRCKRGAQYNKMGHVPWTRKARREAKAKRKVLTHPSRTLQEQLIPGGCQVESSTFCFEMLQLQQPYKKWKYIEKAKKSWLVWKIKIRNLNYPT